MFINKKWVRFKRFKFLTSSILYRNVFSRKPEIMEHVLKSDLMENRLF